MPFKSWQQYAYLKHRKPEVFDKFMAHEEGGSAFARKLSTKAGPRRKKR